jgi:hypothetical protein
MRQERLQALADEARRVAPPIATALDASADRRRLDALVRRTAEATGSRVTLFGVTRGSEGVQIYVATDSTTEVEIRDLRFDVALETARTGTARQATEASDLGPLGEAAQPLFLTVDARRRSVED